MRAQEQYIMRSRINEERLVNDLLPFVYFMSGLIVLDILYMLKKGIRLNYIDYLLLLSIV